MSSSYRGHLDVSKQILAAGADVNKAKEVSFEPAAVESKVATMKVCGTDRNTMS